MENYVILNELGRGGMAKVYLAEHRLLQNKVALKILNDNLVRDQHIRKRFLAEARSMAAMSHPNIIKVIDLFDSGDHVAFVMEYVEGATIKEHIEHKGKLKDDEIRSIFSQMLEAVGYVHEQNLVHRDIKPSNFMIDKKGKIKLMDFGIAKTLDASSVEYTQTGTGMQMGTPMYMSPEQITETKSVTAKSDIYSLGVVLWQMVTGKRPYDPNSMSTFQMQSKIVNEPLEITGTVWDKTIRIATAKEVKSRFMSISEFKEGILGDFSKKAFDKDDTVFEHNSKSQDHSAGQKSNNSNKKFDLDFDNEVERLASCVPTGSDKIYNGFDIPSSKLSNFQARVHPFIKAFGNVKFYFYYDDTIWGKGDDGWAIFRAASGEWIFVLAPYKDSVAVFTLNCQASSFNRLRSIESGGLMGRSLNLLFDNYQDNYEAYRVIHNVSAHGCGDFFEMLNLILEQ